MKKILVLLLLLPFAANADPVKTFRWDAPTLYENNTNIPAGDLYDYMLHCGSAVGGPLPKYKLMSSQTSPSSEDMAFMHLGVVGTYYCAMMVKSRQHGTISKWSNRVQIIITAADLGVVEKSLPKQFPITVDP